MALRLVQFLIPQDYGEHLDDVLNELETIGTWQVATHNDTTLLCVLAEADNAEKIIETVEDMSFDGKSFRAILLEVKATSPPLKDQEDASKKNNEKNGEDEPSPERVACVELVEKLSDGVQITKNYILTIILSVIVVTIGLVRNDTAIIIGAMVIAPFLIPNMALSLATTLGNVKLAKSALKANATGMFLTLLLTASAGLFLQVDPSIPAIANRAELRYSDILLALAAGGAGALSFTSGVSAALVGVMVAVAILPPVATGGLLIGSGDILMGTKALLLTLANIICINLSGVGMFLYQKARPRYFWEEKLAKRMLRIAGVIWIALLLFLVGVIYLNQRF